MDMPEELEFGWLRLLPWQALASASLVCSRWRRLANDESLWEAAFVREFGHDAANSVRTASSVAQAVDILWGASPATTSDLACLPTWFARMTARARPSRKEGTIFQEYPHDDYSTIVTNLEPWDAKELLPHEEDGGQSQPQQAPEGLRAWKAIFLRHHLLTYRWRHGCDPGGQPSSPRGDKICVRAIVAGMKASGKTSFLRTIAPHDPHVEDKGVNVVVREIDGTTLILLEMRRPNNWYKKVFNGESVKGIIFVVDSSEYTAFMDEGEAETEEAYARMEDTYKRFHGIVGEACQGDLQVLVCAHKIDLAQDNEEGLALTEAVRRKLRVDVLPVCTWYYRVASATVSTSAWRQSSCHNALAKFLGLKPN